MLSRDVGAMSALILLVACSKEPQLAAVGTGDVSNAPAARGNTDTALREACGDGALLAGATKIVWRYPYMQQVTATSAQVVTRTVAGQPVSVEFSLPDGTPIASVASSRDDSASGGKTLQGVATITDLLPSTTYCYALAGLTERVGFRTAAASDTAETIRFVAFGDSGSGDRFQRAVYQQMLSVPFDFVVHLGDIAYEKGTRYELETRFFQVYRNTLRSFPVFPALGNHDDATGSGAPYLENFVLPENGPAHAIERQYSFDWGNAHFVSVDTEHMSFEQAEWLDADLSASRATWNIVLAHRPAYSSGEHGSSGAFRKYFGPTLAKHQVPLVLSGHEHDYERVRPQFGTTYIVSGGGGRATRTVGRSGFTAYAEAVLHFVFLEVDANQIAIHAIDGVGREFDSAVITKG